MIVYPCAKINIGLKITGKRSDGYHDLETFFFPVELTDILEVVEAEETILYVYGKKPDCSMEDNLCYKAYQLLKRDFNLSPVEIHLFKRIPYGAGLGGGSSDGSNMLIALNKLFNLGLTDHQLCKYASKLGSDCPFFIYASKLNSKAGEGIYAEGRGDILTPMIIPDLANHKIRLDFSDIYVSTAEAYAGLNPTRQTESLKKLLGYPISEWSKRIINDFEEPVFNKYPVLAEKKQKFYEEGAVYASMSGSGSAIYGIFAT